MPYTYDKNILTFHLGQLQTNCYLISNNGEAVIIDPADRAEFLADKLMEKGLELKYILLTHAHFDHMLACDKLREMTGAPLCLHELDADGITHPGHSYLPVAGIFEGFKPADRLLKEGMTLPLGNENIGVIHTPGHTKGSCCYTYANDVFCGDTIFDGSWGRTDLYGGSDTEMARSLERLHSLYDGSQKRFHPGHGNSFFI